MGSAPAGLGIPRFLFTFPNARSDIIPPDANAREGETMNRVSTKLSALFVALILMAGIAPAAWAADVGAGSRLLVGSVVIQSDVGSVASTDLSLVASIDLSFSSCNYDGSVKSPVVTVRTADGELVEGVDYVLDAPDGRVAAGAYTYTARGVGSYAGSLSATLTIGRISLSQCEFRAIAKQVFTGKAIKPAVAVTFQGNALKEGVDYKLQYSKNVNHGTAKIRVSGIGSCEGAKDLKFAIAPAGVAKAKVSKVKSKTYSGDRQTQNPLVKLGKFKLKQGRDYMLSYKRNVNAGKAIMVVKGKGNFKGKTTKRFRIDRAPIANAQIGSIGTQKLVGGSVCPSPRVSYKGRTLVRGRDYTLKWSGNKSVGTGYVKVIGERNFRGSASRSFRIAAPVSQGVYITNTGECFHRGSCSSLRRSRIPISRADAIAQGFRPCKRCRP